MQGMGILQSQWISLMSRAWKNGSTKGWRVTRARILARDRCCQLCGQCEGPMHIDHIIPLSSAKNEEDAHLWVNELQKLIS